MANVVSFDSIPAVGSADLSGAAVVFLLGYTSKHDGGGGRYERFTGTLPSTFTYPSFKSNGNTITWGLVPEGGAVNPKQFGAKGDRTIDDRVALQNCIDYIDYWNKTVGTDTSRNAIKVVLPANSKFRVNARVVSGVASGLVLRGPITIQGEDPLTSQFWLDEDSAEGGTNAPLFSAVTISGITLRDFTIEGSYTGLKGDHGNANMLKFTSLKDVLFDRVTFAHNRAVIISGDGIENFTMRGCLLSESRRGGLIITDADRIAIEDNDFRWVADDPVAITWTGESGSTTSLKTGGAIRIIGNRCFGCRGINVVGAKNLLIADNSHVLGHGRAIHVGATTPQQKGDTTTLNVVIRNNIITDILDASVDPGLDDARNGGHRAIDIELLYAAAGAPEGASPVPAPFPGLPNAVGVVEDPAKYYYTDLQGLQDGKVWVASEAVDLSKETLYWWLGNLYEAQPGTATTGTTPPVHTGVGEIKNGFKFLRGEPTPQSGTFLVEGNIISRTRIATSDFKLYGVGDYGGSIGYHTGTTTPVPITVPIALVDLIPTQGIAISGAAHAITVRGNQIRDCVDSIYLKGPGTNVSLPFYLQDVFIVDNEIVDWGDLAIVLDGYGWAQPQRVMILNNRADGDPRHRSDRRGTDATTHLPDGSWLQGAKGSFLDLGGVSYAVVAGNHVKNVSRLISNLESATASQTIVMEGNVGYGQVQDTGYNVLNKGIGVIIEPARGWRYVIEASDPAVVPSTYGKLLNACPLAIKLDTGQTEPAGSGWVEGTFVRNIAPVTVTPGSGPKYEVWGWRRSHTAWVEQRVLVA